MAVIELDRVLWTPLHRPGRWAIAATAAISAVAHLPVIAPHLSEAPYMGEEFVVLTVACLAVALGVLCCDSAAAYFAAALVCGAAVIGYVLTRLVAFPQLGDDVGNWFEPLGVVCVLAESATVGVVLWTLLRTRDGSR